ncbi:MAG: prephenate dehydratase [Cyclobacteriaceae bacterium]|nr:prephenate dehydratase [Cyclobacteriaceae bacterium]
MKKNGTARKTIARRPKRVDPLRVAIQGIATSFHEVAALTHFDEPVDTVECLSFPELCEALKNDRADYAVMAIENSIAGSILPNYFLLQQYHFSIVGELYLPIHLHLAALPGVRLADIRTVESHPMAIRQCTEYLQQLAGVAVRESEDTALSAKRIRDLRLKDVAAIANAQAAEKFGLQILEKRIETHRKNFTRFLVLTRERGEVRDSNKASLSFEVANEAGSLARVLVIFSDSGINLTKIQSIPIVGRPQEYTIHVDVEWSRRAAYDQAMCQVMRKTRNLNVLGEYKKATLTF